MKRKKIKNKFRAYSIKTFVFLVLFSLSLSFFALKKEEKVSFEVIAHEDFQSDEEVKETSGFYENAEIIKEEKEEAVLFEKTEVQEEEIEKEEVKDLPPVPLKYRKKLTEADLSYKDNPQFLKTHNIRLKNATQFSDEEIGKLLDTPMKMRFKETDKPQFLIYHTHATESFNSTDLSFYDARYNWRSRDNTLNMVKVGNSVGKMLSSEGIPFIQDTSQHDYPSYNGSYENSFKSVSKYLKENDEIKVALDLHRDAIQKDSGEIIKPTLNKDGVKYAQIMIIANCDDGSGLIPSWRENFRFAKEIYTHVEEICPGLCRPILLSHRKYNQQLSTGSLLIEIGGHGNTLKEAERSGEILGEALCNIYEDFKEQQP